MSSFFIFFSFVLISFFMFIVFLSFFCFLLRTQSNGNEEIQINIYELKIKNVNTHKKRLEFSGKLWITEKFLADRKMTISFSWNLTKILAEQTLSFPPKEPFKNPTKALFIMFSFFKRKSLISPSLLTIAEGINTQNTYNQCMNVHAAKRVIKLWIKLLFFNFFDSTIHIYNYVNYHNGFTYFYCTKNRTATKRHQPFTLQQIH